MSLMITIVLWVAAIVLMAVVFFKMARQTLVLRLLGAFAVISGAIAFECSIASVCTAPLFDSADLAQVVAMSRGYPLYPRPAAGVMSSWTDGPVAGLALLPASLASSPTSQILTAAGINTFLVFGAIVWLYLRAAGPKHRPFALLALLTLLWCVLSDMGMARVAFIPTAAGTMVALMIAAIAILSHRRSTLVLSLAALCTALACWCKTGAVLWFIVPTVYLCLTDGPRATAKFLLLFLLAFALVSIGTLMKFNARSMWYYMVTLPLAQPWHELAGQGPLSAVTEMLLGLLRSAVPALGLGAAALVIQRFLIPPDFPSPPRRWWAHWWIMLPMSAVVLLPGCAFEYLKVAYDPSSMGPVNLFIALAATMALILSYRSLPREHIAGISRGANLTPRENLANGAEVHVMLRNAARPIVVAGLCILSASIAAPTALTPGAMTGLQRTISQAYVNHHETAYAYLQKHPGQGYFPDDPLASLLVSGKLYHSDEGIRLRYRADTGRQLFNFDQIKAHLPAQAHFIAFSNSDQTKAAMNLFPAARKRVSTPELPGFVLYAQ